VAIDPSTKLLLALDVGERTLAMAQRLVHQMAQPPSARLCAVWLKISAASIPLKLFRLGVYWTHTIASRSST
jgi:hypothetical protein